VVVLFTVIAVSAQGWGPAPRIPDVVAADAALPEMPIAGPEVVIPPEGPAAVVPANNPAPAGLPAAPGPMAGGEKGQPKGWAFAAGDGCDAGKGDEPPAGRETFGTAVAFARNPVEALRSASRERKLGFVLHVSGNFEEARFT
jgi:hypothetical protein